MEQLQIAFAELPDSKPAPGETAEQFFRRLTPQKRQDWKKSYELNIGLEEGTIVQKNKITGKLIKHIGIPHMLPIWKKGLDLIKKVILELDGDRPAPEGIHNNGSQNR